MDQRSTIHSTRTAIRSAALIATCVIFAANFVRADAVWTGAVTGPPLIRSIHITGIENESLLFESGGRSLTRELSKVSRISVDNEPTLTAAEDALATDKFDDAIAEYTKEIRSANSGGAAKAWLLDWSSRRLQAIADKTSRFDAAVTAYTTRVQFDAPDKLQRPTIPDDKTSFLLTAATDINSALANPKLTDAQRITLLTFLIDVHRARHDTKAADDATEKMETLLAKDPTNPSAFRAIARRKLQAAQIDFDRKDWRGAFAEVDSNRTVFSDPQQQADALYMLAECRFQIVTAATADTASVSPAARTQAFREAALAFMRVVANFKDLPDHPHVATSLFRVGQLEELLGDSRGAANVYDQLIAQYPEDANVAAARNNSLRLHAAVSAASTQTTATTQQQ